MEVEPIIADRFAVEGVAGSGGMGKVFRAKDQQSGLDVAVKVLSLDATKYSRRFLREAKVMANLGHPNIIRYIDYGQTEKGAPYIVMEWIDGEDLRQRMNRKKLSLEEARLIIAGVGDALAFAHDRGVIHRDLKPSNLMLVKGDIRHIKLLDFGIARWRGPSVEKMTRTGISIGTPGYMAPEQGRGASDMDGRADLYALGCVIYECLLGHRPYQGEDVVAVLARNALDEPPRVSDERDDIHPEFDDLLASMMAVTPSHRPLDGRQMAKLAQALPAATAPPASAPRTLTDKEREFVSTILIDKSPVSEASEVEVQVADGVHALGGLCQRLDDGSTVVIFRNDTGAATDMARRAIGAALKVRKLRPLARMSLATGHGDLSGRRSLTRTIQAAASLLHDAPTEAAPKGQLGIRVDETTARLITNEFLLTPAKRGEGHDLHAASQPNSDLVARADSHFVGRKEELAELRANFDGVVRSNRAAALLLAGPPGVGKSRLCNEAIAQIRESHPDSKVWKARADAFTQGSAFALLRQLVTNICHLGSEDAAELRRRKLVQHLTHELPSSELERVAGFLAELCDIPFPDAQSTEALRSARRNAVTMGDQIRRAFEDLIRSVSARSPLAVVLENLQWGDLPSLRLFDTALRNESRHPWLLVGLARPEIDKSFPDLWNERNLHRIELGGLSSEECAQLARHILGHSPGPENMRRLVELSEGNPFFLEELINELRQGENRKLPGSVLSMALSSIRTLDSSARMVLRAGSIFGRNFWKSGIAELVSLSPEASFLEPLLDSLVSKRYLLLIRVSARNPEEKLYGFRQEIMREAAYSTLTDQDRQLGHKLAGTWLEATGNRDALRLAKHYMRGGLPTEAARWFVRAAELALEGNDLQATLKVADRAIRCGARDLVLGKAHAATAAAYLWRGENGIASEHSSQALELLIRGSDSWAQAAGDGITALGRCGAFGDIVDLAESLLEHYDKADPSPTIVAALSRAASRLFLAGRFSDGCDIFDALPHPFDLDGDMDPAVLGHLSSAYANRALCESHPLDYLRWVDEAASRFEAAGDRRSAAINRVNLGFAHAELGNYQAAEAILRSVLELATRMDLVAIASLARNNLGRVLCCLGHLDEAWDLELIAIESFAMQGDDRMANGSRVYLSQIHQLKGALDLAEKSAREALQISRGLPTSRMMASAQLALVLLERGRPQEALKMATQATELKQSIGPVEEGESLVQVALIESYLQSMMLPEASAALQAAIQRLHQRASLITSAEFAHSFLNTVPENARIIRLAREWGVDTPFIDDSQDEELPSSDDVEYP